MGRGGFGETGRELGGSEVRNIAPYRDEEDTMASSSADAPTRSAQSSNEFDRLSPASTSWKDKASSHIPLPIKKAWRNTVKWVKGPEPPRRYSIVPLFPKIQHAPINLLNRIAPRPVHKFWLLIALYASWLLTFSLVLWSSNAAVEVPGYGSPIRLSCTSSFWSDTSSCGLNGDQCRPFQNSTMAFRCPADCARVQVLNPHAVGDQEVVYQSLVVGGPSDNRTASGGAIQENAIYRGDSFICPAAIHSGFISNAVGGCGVLTLTGEQPSFSSSDARSIQSVGFDSYFPLSFAFSSRTQTECKDLRWPTIIVTALFGALLSIFTTSPAVFFWSIFASQFFTVALASDPPYSVTFYGLLSTAFGGFLPACFCAAVMYKYFIKRSLTNLTAQIEKTVLWLGASWAGAMNNFTFDRIPISRLTPHDIKAQPGAITALIIIIALLIVIALGQAWAFRVEGRMPRYLLLYGIMAAGLLLLLALPGVNLRIHHYILGLLLIPGTSFQNRPSLLYQGLLVGFFINGIARWGFDSIIQTPTELLRGAQQESLLPPIINTALHPSNITFGLGSLPIYDSKLDTTYDGFSILVNDVERFRGYNDDQAFWDDDVYDYVNGSYTWTWTRHSIAGSNSTRGLPEYFRFAYLSGNSVADYTKAGRWDQNGNWTVMKPGPSRVKRSVVDIVDEIAR